MRRLEACFLRTSTVHGMKDHAGCITTRVQLACPLHRIKAGSFSPLPAASGIQGSRLREWFLAECRAASALGRLGPNARSGANETPARASRTPKAKWLLPEFHTTGLDGNRDLQNTRAQGAQLEATGCNGHHLLVSKPEGSE